jgi:hypothetical protein
MESASWVLGAILVVHVSGRFFLGSKELLSHEFRRFALLNALLAGMSGAFLTGAVTVEIVGNLEPSHLAIGAGAGMALFVIVLTGSMLAAFVLGRFTWDSRALPSFEYRKYAFFSALLVGVFCFFLSGAATARLTAHLSYRLQLTVDATIGMLCSVIVLSGWYARLATPPTPGQHHLGE